MNKIERIIYDMVKSRPGLKRAFRNIYQTIFDLMPVKRIKSEYKINMLENRFFGFHDHSPFSAAIVIFSKPISFDASKPYILTVHFKKTLLIPAKYSTIPTGS